MSSKHPKNPCVSPLWSKSGQLVIHYRILSTFESLLKKKFINFCVKLMDETVFHSKGEQLFLHPSPGSRQTTITRVGLIQYFNLNGNFNWNLQFVVHLGIYAAVYNWWDWDGILEVRKGYRNAYLEEKKVAFPKKGWKVGKICSYSHLLTSILLSNWKVMLLLKIFFYT